MANSELSVIFLNLGPLHQNWGTFMPTELHTVNLGLRRGSVVYPQTCAIMQWTYFEEPTFMQCLAIHRNLWVSLLWVVYTFICKLRQVDCCTTLVFPPLVPRRSRNPSDLILKARSWPRGQISILGPWTWP